MIDATDPANIGPEYDGQPALRITVLAHLEGQAFDYESGNAGAELVAAAIRQREGQGRWSWAYVNEGNVAALVAALAAAGVRLTDAGAWPSVGCYLWAADPSGNIAAGRWRLPVRPVAVQDRYLGGYDLSRVAPGVAVGVAGYLDGPLSVWPAGAWSRFRPVADYGHAPQPAPTPGPTPSGESDVIALITCPGQADLLYDHGTVVPIHTTDALGAMPGWLTLVHPWPVDATTYADFAKLVHA